MSDRNNYNEQKDNTIQINNIRINPINQIKIESPFNHGDILIRKMNKNTIHTIVPSKSVDRIRININSHDDLTQIIISPNNNGNFTNMGYNNRRYIYNINNHY